MDDMNNAPEARRDDEAAETGTAIEARREKPALVAGEQGHIVPRTLEEAYRYAVAICKAGLAPDSYKNHYTDTAADPSKVMLGLAAAMEAGLPPLYGLRQIAIVNGRPTIWGDGAVALIQQSGTLERQEVNRLGSEFDEDKTPVANWPDDFGLEVRMFRRGQATPYIGRFTVGDAKRAKLWMNTKKAPWMEHPKRMLLARARAFAARDGFADCLAGIAIREEVEDYAEPVKQTDTSFLDDEPALPGLADQRPAEEVDVPLPLGDAQPVEVQA